MSIQDDIFDVRDALKRKPEAASFERISERLIAVEEELEARDEILTGLRAGIRAVQMITATIPKSRKKS